MTLPAHAAREARETGGVSAWFTPAALLALGSPALPRSPAALGLLILREGWHRNQHLTRWRAAADDDGWEYHISLLPFSAQAAASAIVVAAVPQAVSASPSNPLWSAFKRLPQLLRAEAAARLSAVHRVGVVAEANGWPLAGEGLAVAQIAYDIGVSKSTLWRWVRLAHDVPYADWLPALAPRRAPTKLSRRWCETVRKDIAAALRKQRRAAAGAPAK